MWKGQVTDYCFRVFYSPFLSVKVINYFPLFRFFNATGGTAIGIVTTMGVTDAAFTVAIESVDDTEIIPVPVH